jgi:hypothetical protein
MIVRTLIAALVFGAAIQCQTGLAQQTRSIFATAPTRSSGHAASNHLQPNSSMAYVGQVYAQTQRARIAAQQAYLARAQAEQRRLAALQQAAVLSQNRRYGYGYNPYYPGRAIGYQPNIVWLPSGTRLNVGATVLPNGQVRVTAQPFFSSVPAVHTYNLRTGQIQRIR